MLAVATLSPSPVGTLPRVDGQACSDPLAELMRIRA